MSRIGKKPIALPNGVAININGSELTVKGPKGELTQRFHPDMGISQEDGSLVISRPTEQRKHRALHGLTRSLVNNMVVGVSEGYEIRLEVVGTGYRAEMQNGDLRLALGYSHDIVVVPPPTVKVDVEDRGRIIVLNSVDKALVGQVAADIRKLRKPEPYQGKGVRYLGEAVRQKAGKSGKVGG
jgi:large subunit ribosomal protein L6